LGIGLAGVLLSMELTALKSFFVFLGTPGYLWALYYLMDKIVALKPRTKIPKSFFILI
jgi:hypothetical protein